MLLTIVLNLVLFGPTFENPINTEAALDKGIIFHKEGKILITEKFINVEFLVPFPRYNFTIRQQVETLLNELSKNGSRKRNFATLPIALLTGTKQLPSMLIGFTQKYSMKP